MAATSVGGELTGSAGIASLSVGVGLETAGASDALSGTITISDSSIRAVQAITVGGVSTSGTELTTGLGRGGDLDSVTLSARDALARTVGGGDRVLRAALAESTIGGEETGETRVAVSVVEVGLKTAATFHALGGTRRCRDGSLRATLALIKVSREEARETETTS